MRVLLILWLTLLALTQNPVQALTINQAVDDALQYNPRIHQFLELEDAAGARADQARAPFWPRVEANYTYWRGDREPELDSRDLSLAETSAGYNLFNGGSDWFRLDEAKHRAAAANYQRRSIVADIVLETKQAFIEVLRTKSTIGTEKASVE